MLWNRFKPFRNCTSNFLFSELSIKSVPGNRPPQLADNPVGRYAGALFSAASQKQSLFDVLEDMKYIEGIIKQSATFRDFLKNSAIQRRKQKEVIDSFGLEGLSKISLSFLYTLVDSGRLSDLPKITKKYQEYYKILNKEEDIRIISAKTLSEAQQKRVVESLKKGRKGVSFKVSYEVDSTILGGLQIYSGSTFLDCSLSSRIERLRSQLTRLI